MKINILLFVIAFPHAMLFGQAPWQPTSMMEIEDSLIGDSYFDLQTYASVPQRIFSYNDGTIGAVWTRGMEETSYVDRGTAYNYFDGENWSEWPTTRIESERT
ncbi:MAG: hypothetical protein KDC05_15680, partial [Bacteroidales bacterium]|nr:hypothetical protein [Bacteroidales bacterium]